MTRPPPLFCFSKGDRAGESVIAGLSSDCIRQGRVNGESACRRGCFSPERAFKGQIRRLTAGMTDGRLAVIWTDNGVNT